MEGCITSMICMFSSEMEPPTRLHSITALKIIVNVITAVRILSVTSFLQSVNNKFNSFYILIDNSQVNMYWLLCHFVIARNSKSAWNLDYLRIFKIIFLFFVYCVGATIYYSCVFLINSVDETKVYCTFAIHSSTISSDINSFVIRRKKYPFKLFW